MSDRSWSGGYSDYPSNNRDQFYSFDEPPPPGVSDSDNHETDRRRPSRWDNPFPNNFSNMQYRPRPYQQNNYWPNYNQNYQNFNSAYTDSSNQFLHSYNPYSFHNRSQNRPNPLNTQQPPPQLNSSFFRTTNSFQQRPDSKTTETSAQKGQEERSKSEEKALPGSEAAREKERAEIARRLKDLDTNKGDAKTNSETVQNKDVLNKVQKRSPVQSKLDKRRFPVNVSCAAKTKGDTKVSRSLPQKNNKLPSNGCSTGKRKLPLKGESTAKKKSLKSNKPCPNSASSSEDLKNKILSRLSAMGKEELKKMINNPQCPKSQAIMKGLMKCYQETKALELDKRRFSVAPDSSSGSSPNLQSNNFNFSELPSITMTDLPQELVNQIKSFLGCDVFPTPQLSTPVGGFNTNFLDLLGTQPPINSSLPSNQDIDLQNGNQLPFTSPNLPTQDQFWLAPNSVKPVDTDALSDTTTVRAPSPSTMENSQPVYNIGEEYPFLIIKELSQIDFYIQECLQRRMQLYNDLHIYLQNKQSNSISLPGASQPQTESDSSGVSSTIDHAASATPVEKECEVVETPVPAIIPKPEIIDLEDEDTKEKLNASKNNSKPSRQRNSSFSNKISKCQECHISDPTPVKFTLPEKTNVNDMKLVGASTIVLACEDGRSYGYNCKTGNLTYMFASHTASVTVLCGVSNSDDTFLLCSGSMDEHLCLFDSNTQECIAKHYLASTITSLECNKSRLLYIGLGSGQILKYCLLTKQLMKSQIDFECSSSITALMSSREGPRKILYVAAKSQPLSMRDATSGLLIRTFASSIGAGTYSLAAFGDQLFSGDAKTNVPYFNRLSAVQEGELPVDGKVACIRMYRHILFVACYNGKIHAFDLKNKMNKITSFAGVGVGLSAMQIRNNQIITYSRNKKIESVCFPPEIIASLKVGCACKHVSAK